MKQDNRDPTHIIPFKFPQVDEDEPEVYGSMGILLAIIAMLLKVKLLSFCGLILSIFSWLNMKKSETGGLGSGLSVTMISFLINYAAPFIIPLPNSV
jgi:hypothetical protein